MGSFVRVNKISNFGAYRGQNMNEVKQFVTEQDRQFYNENGYWISQKFIDDERIERLRKAHGRV
jgi:hypothetical protein